jgi:hypothetical protein
MEWMLAAVTAVSQMFLASGATTKSLICWYVEMFRSKVQGVVIVVPPVIAQ